VAHILYWPLDTKEAVVLRSSAIIVALAALAPGLGGCGNTYHPEYHPVTSQQYTQTLAYPVSVTPAYGQGAQIVQAPPPIAAFPPPPPPPPVISAQEWDAEH
jgi:hypothetical protein